MTLHRWAVPLAAAALALTATACTPGSKDGQPEETTRTATATPDSTHDGAAPIATVTSWVKALRAGEGPIACGFATPEFQQVLIAEAISFGSEPTNSCPRAVIYLAENGHAPKPVREFVVVSATDDTTLLTLNRAGLEPEQAILTHVDGAWLLDAVGDAPEPT